MYKLDTSHSQSVPKTLFNLLIMASSVKTKNLGFAVNADTIEADALTVLKAIRPNWIPDDVKFKHFTDGITNKLVGCFTKADPKDTIIIRVNGRGTELIIDRQAEFETFKLLHAAKCGPPLYAIFTTGMAYGFLEGEPLNETLVRDKKVAALIAKQMVTLHNVQPDKVLQTEHQSAWPAKTLSFLKIIPTSFEDPVENARYMETIPCTAELWSEFNQICQQLEALNMPVVFSHNDLLLKNIIFNEKESVVHFIDYEYAFLNYEAYDIGNHFCEYAGIGEETNYDLYPDKAYQVRWLTHFLEEKFSADGRSPSKVTETDIERLYIQTNKCACAAHFFWGLWALIQAKNSTIDFDYLGYGAIRLNEYFRRKSEFFSLQLP